MRLLIASPLVSAEFFDWRVFQNPYKRLQVLVARSGDTITGVSVYALDQKGRCFVNWLDFAHQDAFSRCTPSAIAHLFRATGASYVYTWEPLSQGLRRAFAGCGFMRNPLKRGPFTYRVPLVVSAQGESLRAVDWFAIDNYDLQPLMQD